MSELSSLAVMRKSGRVSRERYEREKRARQHAEAMLKSRAEELHQAREELQKQLFRERKIAGLQTQFIRMAGRELDALVLSIDTTTARIARNTRQQDPGWIHGKCQSIQTTVTRVRVIIDQTLRMADDQQLNRE